MPRLSRSFPPQVLLLLSLLLCATAAATPVMFQVELGDRVETVALDGADIEGLVYVSLPLLLGQLGGDVQGSGNRVELVLGGRSVSIALNDTRVSTNAEPFYLRYPLIRHEGAVRIAVSDVIPLLQRAFGAAVDQQDQDALASIAGGAGLGRIGGGDAGLGGLGDLGAASKQLRDTRVVIIDPGHGGSDIGCRGITELLEKDFALSVAQKVRDTLLQNSKLQVHLTRYDDTYLRLSDRAQIAREHEGGLFISLHASASFSPEPTGVTIFVPSSAASPAGLGAALQRGSAAGYAYENAYLARQLSQALDDEISYPMRGLRSVPLRVAKTLNMPGAILELGYLTNPAEAAALGSDGYQERLAQAIARGILDAIAGNDEDSEAS